MDLRTVIIFKKAAGKKSWRPRPQANEGRFWGQIIPISGSSVQPSIITPHFHEMRRCSSGASASSEYSHIEQHQRLVDSSSVASVGSSASRWHSGAHERVGVMAKCQKECAFSTTEDHFSRRGMGLNVDAGEPVTGTYRVHPVGCEKNKARIKLGQSLTVKQFQRLLGLWQ